MGKSNWFDFEILILAEMAKADAKVLDVEKQTALAALDAHPHAFQNDDNPEQRFVDALQRNSDQTVLHTLGMVCADMPLEQKLSLLRNCWRVAISDEELHQSEEALLYHVTDELKVSRRNFSAEQQRMAG